MNDGQAEAAVRAVLLTGRPGIGKTTVIRRLAELLTGWKVAGFYTDEIREEGHRRGFCVTTFSGGTGVLAHVELRSRQHVGKYGVDAAAFEQVVLPELARQADVFLVDEIGKMECFSAAFIARMRELLAGPTPIVATVAVAGGGLVAEVKSRSDVELWQVTSRNRGALPGQLVRRLESMRHV